MSAPLSPEQRDAILAQLGDAQPATNGLLESFGKSIADRREHDHSTQREDWFCLNLAAYMGERAAPVLRRLLDAEAEAERLRTEFGNAVATVAWLEQKRVELERIANAERERVAELEARPLAWTEKLDLKSLDNLLITLEQAAGHEPITDAIGQIHEVLAEFRAAADAQAEEQFAAEAGGR